MNNRADFTYHSDTNGHFSLIDHFVCSNFLVADKQQVDVLVNGNNTSDHYAFAVDIPVHDHCQGSKCCRKPHYKLRWDRADLSKYQSLCSSMFSQLYIPTDAVLCTNVNCTLHNADLENYYSGIVDCIKLATENVFLRSRWASRNTGGLLSLMT